MEEGVILCPGCENPILGGEPTIHLLCGHSEHTPCFLRRLVRMNTVTRQQCIVCNEYVVPDHLLPEEEEDAEPTVQQGTLDEQIREKYLTDETFKRHVKEYVSTLRRIRKAGMDLNKAIRAKKGALFTEITVIKQRLNELREPHITALQSSPEYKNYKSLKAKYNSYMRRLQISIPGIDESDIQRALRTQRGLRTWKRLGWRYRRTGASLLRSAFYYLIRI
jgi:hypothetical protein